MYDFSIILCNNTAVTWSTKGSFVKILVQHEMMKLILE
jgi:hypothetical protein